MKKKLSELYTKCLISWNILLQAFVIIKNVFKTALVLKEKDLPPIPDEDEEKAILDELERMIKDRPPMRQTPYNPYNIPLNEMIEVPEEKIVQAAEAMGVDQPNSFTMLLMTANAYRAMNVEPVFLINQEQTAIRVASKEVYENPKVLN